MNLWVTKWMLVFTRMALHGHSVTHTRWMPLEFSKLDSGTRNPWIISLVTKWTSGWPNERWSLPEWPCMVIQWPIQYECLWNCQNWISGTLNPWSECFLISEDFFTMLSYVLWFLQPIIWLYLEVERLEAFLEALLLDNMFEKLSLVTISRGLKENSFEIHESFSKQAFSFKSLEENM